MRDEPERDAWLSEALRHAPDASASPPAALSDAILRAARAATRPASTPHAADKRPVDKWLAAWSWLARPPVAAGFASVMVATLAGLMWWGQPIDQTLQRPPAETTAKVEAPAVPPAATAKVEAPAGPSAATAAPEPAQTLRGAANDSTARPAQAPRATAPAPAPAPAPATPTPTEAEAKRSSPKLAETRRDSAAVREERENKAISEKRAPAADSPDRPAEIAAESPAAAPSPFPAPIAPAPAPAFKPPPAPAPAPSPGAATADAGEPSAAVAAAHEERPSRSTAAAGSLAAKESASTPTGRVRQLARNPASTRAASVDTLLASVAEQPERWTWQRSAGPLPVTESLQRWLRELRAGGVQWQEGAQAAPAGKPLRLYRDGTLAATLVVDEAGVWFMPEAGLASRASLPPESAATLRRSLDIAAP
jgi:hypothetical protein